MATNSVNPNSVNPNSVNPNSVNPIVLTPIVLTPIVLTPIELTPIELTPIVLTIVLIVLQTSVVLKTKKKKCDPIPPGHLIFHPYLAITRWVHYEKYCYLQSITWEGKSMRKDFYKCGHFPRASRKSICGRGVVM